MTPQETYITRLRRHRERNRVSLDEIACQTRIKREQLEAFEAFDLTGWPRGIYARAWIRDYANIVGLDPIDTVDEFCRLFPQGDRRAERTLRDFASIIAHDSTYRDEFDLSLPDRRRPAVDPLDVPTQAPTWRHQVLRVFLNMRSLRPGAVRVARSVRSDEQDLITTR